MRWLFYTLISVGIAMLGVVAYVTGFFYRAGYMPSWWPTWLPFTSREQELSESGVGPSTSLASNSPDCDWIQSMGLNPAWFGC